MGEEEENEASGVDGDDDDDDDDDEDESSADNEEEEEDDDDESCKDDPLFRFRETNKTCDMMNSKKCNKNQRKKKIHKYCPMTCGKCGTEEEEEEDDGSCK